MKVIHALFSLTLSASALVTTQAWAEFRASSIDHLQDSWTVRIANPSYQEGATILPIGQLSDPDGSCKAYGFADYAFVDWVFGDEGAVTAVVNAGGTVTGNDSSAPVKSILCRKKEFGSPLTPLKFPYGQKLRVESGVYKLVLPVAFPADPAAIMGRQMLFYISPDSDLEALCKAYRFISYVTHQKDTYYAYKNHESIYLKQ